MIRWLRPPMPRISDFYGITIAMYYRDHNPPHVHAIYGEYEGTVTIAEGAVLAGALPSRALALVQEWLTLNRDAVHANWERARQQLPLERVAPLP